MPEHNDTPTKAKVQGAVECLEAKGRKHEISEVFKQFGVKPTQGYEILWASTARKRHHDPDSSEAQGRPAKLTGAEACEADSILEDEDLGRRPRTRRRILYLKAACPRGWGRSEY